MRVKFLVFLLVFEIVYLLAELGLNAAILNVGSGLVLNEKSVETLEQVGKTLSGIGFGLAIFALFGGHFKSYSAKLKMLAVCIVCGIPTMHAVQTALVDRVIVPSATSEHRGRAEVLVSYRDAMLLTGVTLGDDIPFDADDRASSENLALMTMFPMYLYATEKSPSHLRSMSDWFTDLVRERQVFVADSKYSEYESAASKVRSLYDQYILVDRKGRSISEFEAKESEAWTELINTAERTLARHKDAVRNQFDARINKDLDKFYSRLVTSYHRRYGNALNQCYYSGYSQHYRNTCIKSTEANLMGSTNGTVRHYWNGAFVGKPYNTFCDGNRCPGSKSYVRGVVRNEMAKTYAHYFELPINLTSMDQFLRRPEFKEQVIQTVARSGEGMHGFYLPGGKVNRADFRRNLNLRMLGVSLGYKEAEGFERVPKNLSLDGFYRNELVRKMLESLYGDLPKDIKSIGYDRNGFEKYVLQEIFDAELRDSHSQLRTNVADFSAGGVRESDGEQYVKWMVVAPLALFFSLFFSVLTLMRLPLRLVDIYKATKGHTSTGFLEKSTLVLVVLFVVWAPVYVLKTEATSENAIARMEYLVGEPIKPTKLFLYKWVMNVEPKIYPAGQSILMHLDMDNRDHPLFVD
ncbi:hypothetical protein AB4254_08840 [Vibrio breoganii]